MKLGSPEDIAQNGSIIGEQAYVYSFVYPIDQLTAGSTVSKSITIQQNSEFLWQKATYFARINNTAQLTYDSRVVPMVTFQWTDATSGQQMFDTPPFIDNFWGVGSVPMILPRSKLLERRSTLTVEVTNLHDTDPYQLVLSMVGFKIYRGR